MRKAIIYVALVFGIVACTTDKIDRKAFVQDEINKKLKTIQKRSSHRMLRRSTGRNQYRS